MTRTPIIRPLHFPSPAEEADVILYREELNERLTSLPLSVQEILANTDIIRVTEGIFGSSPYLSQLILSQPETYASLWQQGPDASLTFTPCDENISIDACMRHLREEKARLALTAAVAACSGIWNVSQTTKALSDFADHAVQQALRLLVAQLVTKEILHPCTLETCGIFVLGMGKLGAHELNFSSDIDVILFFDPERLPFAGEEPPRQILVKMTQQLATIIEQRTGDGYVFRMDLRLRPDPFSTPLILSTHAGLTYYESVGQNWERAAYIKARVIAGDHTAGEHFLKELRPFMWRKHLDFAAIADIESIKRQIDGRHGPVSENLAGHNIKLGAGGIRDIELFTQTQQLIWGGRMPGLRLKRTQDALRALAAQKIIEPETAEKLCRHYDRLREIEHAIQMIDDQQTHTLPEEEPAMQRVASLLGEANLSTFRTTTHALLKEVSAICRPLFENTKTLSSNRQDTQGRANLVFTGNEDDPDTVKTLAGLGYQEPSAISRLIRQWHSGTCRATRSKQARELLTELIPDIIDCFAASSTPDDTFRQLDRFFHSLPAGIQVLSTLAARPELLILLRDIFSSAPRLSGLLCQYPHIIDRFLATRRQEGMPDISIIRQDIRSMLSMARDGEDRLHMCRQLNNEYQFLTAVQVLDGRLPGDTAGYYFSAIADDIVEAVLQQVAGDMQAQYDAPPNGRHAILALGKWGGEQLTFASDLDLIFLYDADDTGSAEHSASTYYNRFAQRFYNALTAMMKFGRLYAVDMRLRPHGNDGPMATSLASFRPYYEQEAWSYELLALTRARPVCGDTALIQTIRETLHAIFTRSRDLTKLDADMDELRERIRKELPPTSLWDIKRQRGGLLEIEMFLQTQMIKQGMVHPNSLTALTLLGDAGHLEQTTYHTLQNLLPLFIAVQQLMRLTQEEDTSVTITHHLHKRLSETLHAADITTMQEVLAAQYKTAYTLMEQSDMPRSKP